MFRVQAFMGVCRVSGGFGPSPMPLTAITSKHHKPSRLSRNANDLKLPMFGVSEHRGGMRIMVL